ncbi:MAG: UDP-glucose/GDP-mannose dehydrogenase family protein [Bacteroidota bacterium]
MNIAVIGTGYVGLVGGTCFAEVGNQVLCVDNNPDKLARLKAGEVPIYEPGLEVLFSRNTQEGRLHFTDSLAEAVAFADIIFLALPTPPMEDGSADLQYVLGVASQIGPMLTEYKVIVNKSTVPVGTAEKVRKAIAEKTDMEFDVVSNPEFLREGYALEDFLKPERIVIGTRSEKAMDMMTRLYKPFVRSGNPIIQMDEPSAELTKYAANSFLATKISFMNEIANLCEKVGADVDAIRRGIGTDSRIGPRFLFPGVGYGGSCFPKDVSALFKTARQYAYQFSILDAVMQVNQKQKEVIVDKVVDYFGKDLRGKTFGIWGLSFKPNTDDIREAPALIIIEKLLAMGAKVKAFDPEAMGAVQTYTDLNIDFQENAQAAAADVDALLIITEWNEFRSIDLAGIKAGMRNALIFDGRNLYAPKDLEKLGFTYFSIGRPDVHQQTLETTKHEQ